MTGVKVSMDKNAILARLSAACGKDSVALTVTSEQALKDCNYYCPNDTGALVSSSITNSLPEDGKLIWNTPYARYLYYGLLMVSSVTGSAWAKEDEPPKVLTNTPLVFGKDPNQNACKMWCAAAKSAHGKDWQRIFQKKFSEGLK